jgi:hypothetical protein
MKRYFFVAVIASLAVNAFAQTKTTVNVADTVNKMASRILGVTVVFDPPIDPTATAQADTNLLGIALIKSLVGELGYSNVSIVNDVLYIRKSASPKPANRTVPVHPSTSDSTDVRRLALDYHAPRGEPRPDAPNPWDRIEWMRTQGYKELDVYADDSAVMFARKRLRAASGFDTRYAYGSSLVYGGGWVQEGCSDGRPTSYLELQYRGEGGEKHLWMISVNGVGVGTVDQADSLNQRLKVCTEGAAVVTVEKVGLPWKWERDYSLRAFTPTEVPVGEFLELDRPRVKRQ